MAPPAVFEPASAVFASTNEPSRATLPAAPRPPASIVTVPPSLPIALAFACTTDSPDVSTPPSIALTVTTPPVEFEHGPETHTLAEIADGPPPGPPSTVTFWVAKTSIHPRAFPRTPSTETLPWWPLVASITTSSPRMRTHAEKPAALPGGCAVVSSLHRLGGWLGMESPAIVVDCTIPKIVTVQPLRCTRSAPAS